MRRAVEPPLLCGLHHDCGLGWPHRAGDAFAAEHRFKWSAAMGGVGRWHRRHGWGLGWRRCGRSGHGLHEARGRMAFRVRAPLKRCHALTRVRLMHACHTLAGSRCGNGGASKRTPPSGTGGSSCWVRSASSPSAASEASAAAVALWVVKRSGISKRSSVGRWRALLLGGLGCGGGALG